MQCFPGLIVVALALHLAYCLIASPMLLQRALEAWLVQEPHQQSPSLAGPQRIARFAPGATIVAAAVVPAVVVVSLAAVPGRHGGLAHLIMFVVWLRVRLRVWVQARV